jgi:hypothetical protein
MKNIAVFFMGRLLALSVFPAASAGFMNRKKTLSEIEQYPLLKPGTGRPVNPFSRFVLSV